MRTFLISVALLAIVAIPAKADRPVTDAEHARLADALTAQGCTGGKMEWDDDDREFEVEDAICDGRKYELKFDAEFLFKSKKTDD
jgi:hypothetical protein